MNPPTTMQQSVSRLLDRIHADFYKGLDPRTFHRDCRLLLYALTWPAHWLHERGMPAAPQRFERIIADRLDDIAAHGDPDRYRAYFPRYLLKSIQDWFRHHGDDLYAELKLLRNQTHRIDRLITIMSQQPFEEEPADCVEPLAQAHLILLRQHRRKTSAAKNHPRQIPLF